MDPKRILIVDDDQMVRKALTRSLGAEGYSVAAVGSADDAMRSIEEGPPDLLLLDLTLVNECAFNGIIDGFSLLNWLKFKHTAVGFPVIIYTGDNSPAVDRHAQECHAYAVVRKGESLTHLFELVRGALADGDEKVAAG
jgi:DNA-binding NtrC family response regulator